MIASICSEPKVLEIMRLVNIFISIIRIIVPILLIFSLMFKFMSVIKTGNEDELAKVKKSSIINVVAAVLIFLIPNIISIIVKIGFKENDYDKCLEVNNITITEAYEDKMENLVLKAEETLNINDYSNALNYLNNIKDENKRSSYANRLKKVKEKIDERNNTETDDDNGILKIYFISNKRKDAYLIVGNNSTLFIDGGVEYDGNIALNFMQKLGIKRIDGLIGSHLDDDHVGAHKKIINSIEVGHVYYGIDPRTCLKAKTCEGGEEDPTKLADLISSKNIPITILTPGQNVKVENITFDIIGPLEIGSSNSYKNNYNSLNMILKFGNNKFYFAGDYIQEDLIMSRYSKDVLKVDVFKYPHHGENVVSDKFIDIISPKYVIVPGFNKSRMKINFNKFNSMSSEVLLVGNKDNVGNVLIESDGSNLTVTKMFNP